MSRLTFLSFITIALPALAAPAPYALFDSSRLISGKSTMVEILSYSEPGDDAYAVGSKALEQQHWAEAVAAFDQVINAKSKRSDAALYWKAYSLNKLGNGQSAQATCFQLQSQFAKSQWNKDCSAISLELRADAQVPRPPVPPVAPVAIRTDGRDRDRDRDRDRVQPGSDEDLKMLALNSLLNQDPTRAVPMLRGILTGNQSMALKKHALFVLAQSKSPEAQAALHDAVMSKADPELQKQAIQSMAVFQGKKANDTLVEIYKSTSDVQIKRAVISAIFITQDAAPMVELARNEKDLELKRRIVSQLAIMHDKAATDYMMELLK